MIPIHTVFGGLLVVFALIGSLRGWAKEVIVAFSVILALFVEHVLLNFVPPIGILFSGMDSQTQFYIRAALFIVLTVFGYASPSIVSQLGAKVVRERFQDLLLGFFLGLVNGLLIVGTLLSFLAVANYGVPPEMLGEREMVDENGEPVLDEDGNPVMELVYLPGAKGIGGITPPDPNSTSANLLVFMPPELIAKSSAVLYIAVAAAFVFVIVVFI
jgi:amino acid transporter